MNDAAFSSPLPPRPGHGPAAFPPPGPPAGPPAGPPVQRPRRGRWAAALGGGVAGAVLACAVAVPVTLQLQGDPTSGAPNGSDGGSASIDWPSDGSIDDLIDRGTGGADDAADGEVSDAGVLLIETVVGQGQGEGAGTGMVLTGDGLAVTNYHVVDGSSQVQATVASSGETYTADVLGYDEDADVAVLRLEGAEGLDTVRIDDDGVQVGDAVTALGNGSGQGFLSEVTGDVTDLDQSITIQDQLTGSASELEGVIETDLQVIPGYSGGPLFDAQGEVVGINTAASSTNGTPDSPFPALQSPARQSPAADGLGDTPFGAPGGSVQQQVTDGGGESYARPIDEALQVVEVVLAGQSTDDVHVGANPYLGVSVDARAAAQGQGVPVAAADAGTPAAQAGIVAGDTITSLDGQPLSGFDDLSSIVASHEIGDRVEVTWTTASGEQRSAGVTLGESPLN